MNSKIVVKAAGLALFLAVVGGAAQGGAVKSLRGGVALPDNTPPAAMFEQKMGEGTFSRYHQVQPPLIPHDVEDLATDLEDNACLGCHDKTNFEDTGAPMAGASHYVGPDGKAGEEIYMGRYFCRQCHVPQADTGELVGNTYQGLQ